MTNVLSETPPVTISDRLFVELRQAILTGQMQPGQKISEPELSNTYGVSRGSLREAISKLENCSLITRKPNIGARVVNFSVEQLIEIYQIREAMEGLAARLAAHNMTDEEIDKLGDLMDLEIVGAKQLNKNKGFPYLEADLDFHFCIIQGSRNQRLIRMLCNDLYDLVLFYRQNLMPNHSQQAVIEHELIVDAIRRRDGEMAELLMRHHIRASRERAGERLGKMSAEEQGH